MKTPPYIRKHSPRGFTLPEVVIAVAIAALGLVSLLGLMPQSLDMLRKSSEISAESRIAQQIIGGISMSDWQDGSGNDQLGASYDGRRYFFDDLALELEKVESDFDVTFVAEVSIAPADVALPGGGAAASSPDPNLRRVTVKVATTGIQDFDFDKARSGSFHTYASVISRTGK